MKYLWLLLIILFFNVFSYSQNVIPNGDFDSISNEKGTFKPWSEVGTVDFYTGDINGGDFLKKTKDKNYKPRNAYSNHAYIGIRVNRDYREFISVKLNNKLEKDGIYVLEFYTAHSIYANSYCKNFGALISPKKVSLASEIQIEANPPQVYFSNQEGLFKDTAWTYYSFIFIAQGGEQYFNFGNFSPKRSERVKCIKLCLLKTKGSYYYFDNFSLSKVNTANNNKDLIEDYNYYQSKDNKIAMSILLNKDYCLSVNRDAFENNELLKANKEIQDIIKLLVRNRNIKLQIVGCDDNKTSHLSKNDAMLLIDYLKQNDIYKNQLQYKNIEAEFPLTTKSVINYKLERVF